MDSIQESLFPASDARTVPEERTGSFTDNMKLPVHRWFRYSAGFSAEWAGSLIAAHKGELPVVLDPFAGSGTTLIEAEQHGARAYGIEAHPFVARIAAAKLAYRSSREAFATHVLKVEDVARGMMPNTEHYPELVRKCYTEDSLQKLDQIRRAYEFCKDGSESTSLTWLALVSILRAVSHVGTAPWQYVLPNKSKKKVLDPVVAFDLAARAIGEDMRVTESRDRHAPRASLIHGDARTCEGIPDDSVDLVVTSPPYANNYDYADATRLEMSFMGEVDSWSDLKDVVRQHLVR